METKKEEGLQIKITLDGKEYTMDEAKLLYEKLQNFFTKNNYYCPYPGKYEDYTEYFRINPVVTYAISSYNS